MFVYVLLNSTTSLGMILILSALQFWITDNFADEICIIESRSMTYCICLYILSMPSKHVLSNIINKTDPHTIKYCKVAYSVLMTVILSFLPITFATQYYLMGPAVICFLVSHLLKDEELRVYEKM